MNDKHLRQIRENVEREAQLRTRAAMTEKTMTNREIAEKWAKKTFTVCQGYSTYFYETLEEIEQFFLSAIIEATACAEERSAVQQKCIDDLEAAVTRHGKRIGDLEQFVHSAAIRQIEQEDDLGNKMFTTGWAACGKAVETEMRFLSLTTENRPSETLKNEGDSRQDGSDITPKEKEE